MNGDGRVFPNGNFYYMDFYDNGTRHRENTFKATQEEAKKVLQARLKVLHAAQVNGTVFISAKANKMRVSKIVDALQGDFQLRKILSEQNECNLARVKKDFGDRRATQLTAEEIDAYIAAREAAGDANASINRTLQLLKQAYRLAIKRGHLARVPDIRKLVEDNVREGFFSAKQARAVIANLPDDGLRDFVLFAYLCGWRKGSIAKLRWSAVDMEAGEILLPGKYVKNKKPLKLAIEGELADVLNRRDAARSVNVDGVAQLSEFVFHRKGKSVDRFNKSFRAACKKAGCPERLFHDFRRTAARDLIRSGVAAPTAMKICGWRTLSILTRYTIADDTDMREGLLTVAAHRTKALAAKPKVVGMANES
jgi:integrase